MLAVLTLLAQTDPAKAPGWYDSLPLFMILGMMLLLFLLPARK